MGELNNFGEWLRCADGRCHYFLGSVPLCGTATRVVTPQPARPKDHSGCPFYRLHCGECVNRNLRRWLTAYQPPEAKS